MKKSKKRKILTPYKKRTPSTNRLSFLFILLMLFSFLILIEHFSSFIQRVEPKKAFATDDLKKSALLLTQVQVLGMSDETDVQEDSTQPIASLFSINPTLEASPSPTPTPQSILQNTVPNDFCINVPILMYHHVQPIGEAQALGHAQLTVDNQTFEDHINYLIANGYHFVSTSDVVAALYNHQQLPEKSIAVTLDDGYDDAYNYAFPIAKKYNIVLDLMIPSGLIGNTGYMNWMQLKEMSENSLIHIYNHTWSHTALGNADPGTIEKEIMLANNQLETILGKKITIFTYPYGSFGQGAIDFLKSHGFTAGVSTIDGKEQCQSYIMTLHRTRIGNTTLTYYGF